MHQLVVFVNSLFGVFMLWVRLEFMFYGLAVMVQWM